jgi:hypothetical protein
MLTPFATKSDLDALRRELRGEIALVREQSKADLRRSTIPQASILQPIEPNFVTPGKSVADAFAIETRALALRLGSLQIITMVLLFAALKLT